MIRSTGVFIQRALLYQQLEGRKRETNTKYIFLGTEDARVDGGMEGLLHTLAQHNLLYFLFSWVCKSGYTSHINLGDSNDHNNHNYFSTILIVSFLHFPVSMVRMAAISYSLGTGVV